MSTFPSANNYTKNLFEAQKNIRRAGKKQLRIFIGDSYVQLISSGARFPADGAILEMGVDGTTDFISGFNIPTYFQGGAFSSAYAFVVDQTTNDVGYGVGLSVGGIDIMRGGSEGAGAGSQNFYLPAGYGQVEFYGDEVTDGDKLYRCQITYFDNASRGFSKLRPETAINPTGSTFRWTPVIYNVPGSPDSFDLFQDRTDSVPVATFDMSSATVDSLIGLSTTGANWDLVAGGHPSIGVPSGNSWYGSTGHAISHSIWLLRENAGGTGFFPGVAYASLGGESMSYVGAATDQIAQNDSDKTFLWRHIKEFIESAKAEFDDGVESFIEDGHLAIFITYATEGNTTEAQYESYLTTITEKVAQVAEDVSADSYSVTLIIPIVHYPGVGDASTSEEIRQSGVTATNRLRAAADTVAANKPDFSYIDLAKATNDILFEPSATSFDATGGDNDFFVNNPSGVDFTSFDFDADGTTNDLSAIDILDGGGAAGTPLHWDSRIAARFGGYLVNYALSAVTNPELAQLRRRTTSQSMSHAYTQFGTPGPAGGPASGGWA